MNKTAYLAVLLVSLNLFGCGGGGGGGDTADTTAPSVASLSPTTQLIKQTVVINILFDESIDTTSLNLGGSFASESDGGVWSQTGTIDDTLTITPKSNWSVDTSRTLVINAKDLSGNAMAELTLSYDVYRGTLYYVDTNRPDDNGDGLSPASARQFIHSAVAEAIAPATILVSAGEYRLSSGLATQVVLRGQVSLYGGYNADFSVRDPTTNLTQIVDRSVDPALSTAPNRAIEGTGNDLTAGTIIDGFTIQGSEQTGSTFNSAIFLSNGASPTIQNNTIHGGSGSSLSYGMYNDNASPNVQNNTINGGSGGNLSYGMYNNLSSLTVQNNTINGGTGNSSYGMYNNSSSLTVQNNTIIGGSAGFMASVGIRNIGGMLIVQNNIIHGGNTSHTRGIESHNATLTVQNNTIHGGSGSNESWAIYSSDMNPTLYNNILITAESFNSICYARASSLTDYSMQNNNFVGCPVIYRVYAGYPVFFEQYLTILEINALTGSRNNIAIDPMFVDLVGGNYHFSTSSPAAVTAGGLNGVDEGWGFSDDKDGVTRPASGPWAIGAYEPN